MGENGVGARVRANEVDDHPVIFTLPPIRKLHPLFAWIPLLRLRNLGDSLSSSFDFHTIQGYRASSPAEKTIDPAAGSLHNWLQWPVERSIGGLSAQFSRESMLAPISTVLPSSVFWSRASSFKEEASQIHRDYMSTNIHRSCRRSLAIIETRRSERLESSLLPGTSIIFCAVPASVIA